MKLYQIETSLLNRMNLDGKTIRRNQRLRLKKIRLEIENYKVVDEMIGLYGC